MKKLLLLPLLLSFNLSAEESCIPLVVELNKEVESNVIESQKFELCDLSSSVITFNNDKAKHKIDFSSKENYFILNYKESFYNSENKYFEVSFGSIYKKEKNKEIVVYSSNGNDFKYTLYVSEKK